MNRPTITAHSGCEGTADGSLEAIERGIALGADLVEVDVRRVPGRGLMLTHDAVDDPSGLVPLEAAFALIARHPGVGINCDLKEYGLARDVMAQASGLSDGQLAFSGSLKPSQLMADPEIVRHAKVYLNIEEVLCELLRSSLPKSELPSADAHPWDVVRAHTGDGISRWIEPLIKTCKATGVCALNLPPRPFVRPHLSQLGDWGVRCSVWTINEPDAMRELLALPYLENLTTRQVALAISARGALGL